MAYVIHTGFVYLNNGVKEIFFVSFLLRFSMPFGFKASMVWY